MRLLAPDDPRWLDLARRHADATIFHHPAWAKLLADCYGYRAMLAADVEGDAVIGGLPLLDVSLPFRRRWVALPFTDVCPPLLSGDAGQFVDDLGELARAARLDSLQIRAPLPAHAAIHSESGFVRHELQLSGDVRAIWKQLRRNHRRSVVDAEEAGVRTERESSARALETFYSLHLQTRRRLGVPVQPRRFFRLLSERIVEPGLGFVLTAYHGSRPAAAAVFCGWNGTLVCKYSARADGFVKSDAIHLLFWTAIRWACENGYRVFDLGRSSVDQAQLRSFKTGWAARELDLPYSRIARRPTRSSPRRLHSAMGIVIRHSQPWLCQAMGELLYKYAG